MVLFPFYFADMRKEVTNTGWKGWPEYSHSDWKRHWPNSPPNKACLIRLLLPGKGSPVGTLSPSKQARQDRAPEWGSEVQLRKLQASLWQAYFSRWRESLKAKLGPTLSDTMDHGPPGSSAHGISQVRILEWVATSFFRVSSQLRDWTCISCLAGGFFTIEASGKPQVKRKKIARVTLRNPVVQSGWSQKRPELMRVNYLTLASFICSTHSINHMTGFAKRSKRKERVIIAAFKQISLDEPGNNRTDRVKYKW